MDSVTYENTHIESRMCSSSRYTLIKKIDSELKTFKLSINCYLGRFWSIYLVKSKISVTWFKRTKKMCFAHIYIYIFFFLGIPLLCHKKNFNTRKKKSQRCLIMEKIFFFNFKPQYVCIAWKHKKTILSQESPMKISFICPSFPQN